MGRTKIKKAAYLLAAGVMAWAVFGGNCPPFFKTDNQRTVKAAEISAAESLTGAAEGSGEGIYVGKLEIGDSFLTGVDISSYLALKESGVRYFDFEGNELSDQEFFDFLYGCGVNSVRIRIWNDPYDEKGNGYGGGNNDLEKAVVMGQYATNAGMSVLIDLHYSDFWADPGKQKAPKAWESLSFEDKAAKVGEYTKSVMNTLIDAGVNVTMVQIGNETTTGFIGETSFSRMCGLMAAGCDAVKETAPEVRCAIHFTNVEKGNYVQFAEQLKQNGVNYDVFASSYYPFWHGSLENLTKELKKVAENYSKDVMVAETSYAYTLEDGDGNGNTIGDGTAGIKLDYEVSVQGQANLIHDVAQAVLAVGDRAVGIYYWEPAWLPVNVYDPAAPDAASVLKTNKEAWEKYGSGWASSYAGGYDTDAAKYYGGGVIENQAWFDFYGHPLETANIYRYLREGNGSGISIVSVEVPDLMFEEGEKILLPQNGDAVYTDGSRKTVEVFWNAEDSAGITQKGEYQVRGTAAADEAEFAFTCTVTVKPKNLLNNPGFEDEDMSAWKIVDQNNSSPIVARKKDPDNVRTGDYCLHFWDSKKISYVVCQTVYLKKGTYTLGSWLEGGSAGNNAVFELFAVTDTQQRVLGENGAQDTSAAGGAQYKANTGVTKWMEYQNPEISNIVIEEDGMPLTIGIRVECAANGWGAWDDFYLFANEPEGGLSEHHLEEVNASSSETDQGDKKSGIWAGSRFIFMFVAASLIGFLVIRRRQRK